MMASAHGVSDRRRRSCSTQNDWPARPRVRAAPPIGREIDATRVARRDVVTSRHTTRTPVEISRSRRRAARIELTAHSIFSRVPSRIALRNWSPTSREELPFCGRIRSIDYARGVTRNSSHLGKAGFT